MRNSVEIPSYQPFYLPTVDALREEIARLGLTIGVADDFAPLRRPLELRGRPFTNRFCAQPIAGGDATPGGGPGALTRRRYRRLAQGGFGLIWMEGAATGSSGKPQQLCLNRSTWPEFRALVDELRAASDDSRAVLILQLLDGASGGEIVEAAALAAAAGFDGVDLQLPRDLLAPALATIRQTTPQLLLSTRLHVYEAVRGGFGVHRSDYRKPDLTEPARFIAQLRAGGLDLLNLSIASPILTGPDRGLRARRDSETADEHPLTVLQRLLSIAQELRSSVPGLPIVAGGLSWLRQFIPHVAAAALAEGVLDFAGLGRAALAHPFAPAQLFADGALDAGATCILCSACSLLRDEGEQVGCVIRDGGTYGPVYQQMRRFDADRLRAGAARCHLCEAAPCIRASPTRTGIPAFIEAFRKGDEAGAYEIIRRSDPLPELTSRLAPGWLESEGACVETALTGTPVPILDLQYVIAWRARDRAQTGVRLPAVSTGHSIAIVGGGPTGLTAAVRLLEYGHTVHLLEQAHHLGGAPERVIPHTRHPGAREEIAAVLQPALSAGRLHLHLGVELGDSVTLDALLAEHQAVLLASGLWRERSLGEAIGVIGALTFLETPPVALPARIALLAGGDSAMDAARVAHSRGARELYVIFGGARSDMHWHMPESWFATPGVHAMMHWQPLGYETNEAGVLRGLRLRHHLLHTESVLPVDLVIEAMGLQVPDSIRAALATPSDRLFTAGALVNGGASVSQCVADGLRVAAEIHHHLSPS